MTTSVAFHNLDLKLANVKTYVFAVLFAAGNIILPQLCHLMPQGGFIFLPIYFFTLIAAYKFGIKVGLITAILSVSLNHLLFGMPELKMLPILLIKSGILAVIAGLVATKSKKLSLLMLLIVVLSYQFLGGLVEWALDGFNASIQDFKLGWPGMILQVFGGWLILKAMAKYE